MFLKYRHSERVEMEPPAADELALGGAEGGGGGKVGFLKGVEAGVEF